MSKKRSYNSHRTSYLRNQDPLVERNRQMTSAYEYMHCKQFDDTEDYHRCCNLIVISYLLITMVSDKVDEMENILEKYGLMRFGTKKAANDAERSFRFLIDCVRGHISKGSMDEFNRRFMGDYEELGRLIDEFVESEKEDTDKTHAEAPNEIWLTHWMDDEVRGKKRNNGIYSVRYVKA